jgi:hypothetical protein
MTNPVWMRVIKLLGRYWTVLLVFGVAIGCESRDNRTSSVETTASPTVGTPISCLHAGPLACDTLPVQDLVSAGCSQLQASLAGRQVGEDLVKKVTLCERPVFSGPSNVGEAAAMSVTLDVDGPPVHVAYLFVKGVQGWCPVDQVFEPTYVRGGYCKTQFDLRWEQSSVEQSSRLILLGQRRCHEPLDKSEMAAGESDVTEEVCREIRYTVDRAPHVVRKLSEAEAGQACQSQ